MSAILKFDFQKRKQLRFWSKSSKVHKKDPILHVTTTFSVKQRETRTNSVPIPYPYKNEHGFQPLTRPFSDLLDLLSIYCIRYF